jgi:Carboxypeptidase regulatory-like domain/TonB dependent receptor
MTRRLQFQFCPIRKVVTRGIAALALSLCLMPGAVRAQTAAAGTITGTLTDQSGAVVPAATVVVQNVETGVKSETATNSAGIYIATFLQPGQYDVTVNKTGFAKMVHTGLTLQVGQTLEIDFQLPLQSTQEAVTVTAAAPVVDAEKTEQSQVIDHGLVENLPIVGRRWDNFVLLTPGVTTDGALVSYRGISGLYNNNSVDGANNNQAFFSEARGRSAATTGVPYIYSLDAIQEFQVSASNYSAEFGQAAGGVVNAITKSGANTMHGDLFYYLRYPSLNALDPVNKANGILTQPVHQQQQFGGSAGGALVKDKLFYFVNYDGSRKVFPISYISTSKFPLACPTQATAAQCTAANNYLFGLTGAFPRTGVNDIAFGKLDYQASARNRLSASFDLDDYHAPNSYNSNTTVSNNSVTANGPIVLHERFFVGSWESTVTPTVFNSVRAQWGVDDEVTGVNDGGPSTTIASVMAYGMPNALPRPGFPDEHRYQIADTVSISRGRHQMKMGFDLNFIHELAINLFQGGGIYSYSGSAAAAFSNWVLDVYGLNAGDGLTGKHYSSFTQVTDPITGVGKDDFYDNDYTGFFEDSWKARPNLTLNLGMRYELQTVPQPPRPNTATPLTTLYTSTLNIDKNNFAPRVGIAWQPAKNTVVRAGWGIFYAKTSNSTFYALRVENGVYQQTFNCLATTCPQLTFPNVIFTPPGPTPQAPFAGALTPQVTPFTPPALTQLSHGLVPDFVNPLVHEGEITIEHQLPGQMSVSGGWIFSRGEHLPVFVDSNVAPATTTHTYAVLNSAGGLAENITEPFYTTRLNPQTGVILNGFSIVNSWYNALVLTLRKPISHGVEALINYTFSKSIDDGAVAGANGTFFGTDWPLDPKNQKQENSLSDLNQKQRFVASLVYTPQVFKKLTDKPLRLALDGFSFSGVVTESTGQPVFAQISGFPSGGVDYGVTGGEITNTGGSTGGRPPQVGRNVYIGPPLHNVDFRIMRQFAITEKYRLQVLGEAFNIFNHTNFSAVNGTAFNYAAVGAATCPASIAGSTNGCIVPNPTFLLPTGSSSANGLYTARQLQVSAKFVF